MFSAGQVIYFTPFYFKNGNTSKNKYFVVLKNIDGTIILASLPTSVNRVPSLISKAHGCINIEERCFNCYLFEPGRPICENGFAFELPTFIYGSEVEDYEVGILRSVYGIEGVDFEIVGQLQSGEFDALILCLLSSGSVKRKIKRMLSS